jgi:uncharacterized protein YndB with AHSA1/START domain
MPRDKDLKRLVRTRMKKTGEAYTAARAQLLAKPRVARRIESSAAPAESEKPDYAALAGISDDVIKTKTGCTWERWVHALDRLGAETMSHRDIATLVKEKYKVAAWWTQAVTVGYERIKGLRERGQQRDGTYEASKSRTFNVPVSVLFEAWADAKLRKRWLDAPHLTVRSATAPKAMRIKWSDDTVVIVGFTTKGKTKSAVAIEHTKLPDREAANRLKGYWAARFDALGEVLAAG